MIPECLEKWDWDLETNLQGYTSKSINLYAIRIVTPKVQYGFVCVGVHYESPRAGLGTRFCTPHSLGLEEDEEVRGGLGSGSGDEHSDLD